MTEKREQTQYWIARPPLESLDLSRRLAQRASHRRVVRSARETQSASPAHRTRTPESTSNIASARGAEGWTLLRRIRVQQVEPPDAVAQIRVKIAKPGEAERARRALHIRAEDLEALTSNDAFKEINVEAFTEKEKGATLPRRGSMPSLSGANVYAYEPKQAALESLGCRLETWAHCTPCDEEDVFVVIIQARLRAMAPVADVNWRLCKGVARSLPEMSSFGINSVDIDGARQLPTPAGLKLDLMPHQGRSLSWMIMREKFGLEELCVSEFRVDRPIELVGVDLRIELRREDAFFLRGGLLCDVVGSGKTATILALVLENSSFTYVPVKCRSGVEDCASSTKATLVLCPSNVHAQWLGEVEKFCPAKLKVVSIRTLEDLHRYDVAHLMEADLVVAPYDIIGLDSSDVPLTLERMSWHRVVLDEFHEICSKRAARHEQLLATIQSLEAAKRWGMSGTPESFLSSPATITLAAKFFRCCVNIRSAPTFVEHFCRQARVRIPVEVHDHVVMVSQTLAERAVYYQKLMEERLPQNLNWSNLKGRAEPVQALLKCCSHFATNACEHVETAEKVCERMFARMRFDVNQAKRALTNVICKRELMKSQPKFFNLAQKILDVSCGRTHGERGLQFFQNDITESVLFEEASNSLQSACTRVDDAACEDEHLVEVIANIKDACNAVTSSLEKLEGRFKARFEELPELKGQIPDYIKDLKDKCNLTIDAKRRYMFFQRTNEALNGDAGDATCPVCLEDMDARSAYILFCGHALCVDCAPRLPEAKCPVCRYKIPQLASHSVRLGSDAAVPPRTIAPAIESAEAPISDDRAHWSSKLRMLVGTLESIHSREPGAKVIVFMQWECLKIQTSRVLTEIGVKHLSLEGDIFNRTHALQEFQSNESIPLLLLSLEHSASGTNLTVASHVFLMHPMLASSQEEASSYEAQAIGRVVRLGQTRPVHVWRFVTSRTVEEKLWQISGSDP